METTLGKRIAACRKRLGLTQDQLAEKLGLTAQAVSKWENDQSCPDISILPKLADIFSITTDELLGHETVKTVSSVIVNEDAETEDTGFTFNNGKMDFHWNAGRKEGLGLACWVLLTGMGYLITQLIPDVEISFWNILWPSFLIIFGIFGLYPKFSVFRLGCALAGGAFLVTRFLPVQLEKGIILAVIVLLFGLSLLAEALRKAKKPVFSASYTDETGKVHRGKFTNDYTVDGNHFTYDANFGNSIQLVKLETMSGGSISTNFGEYTVDLTGVAAVESPCRLAADCSFGELTILVPRHFTVIADTSTSFASFQIQGHPDPVSQGTIYLNADANFGEITVNYQ